MEGTICGVVGMSLRLDIVLCWSEYKNNHHLQTLIASWILQTKWSY